MKRKNQNKIQKILSLVIGKDWMVSQRWNLKNLASLVYLMENGYNTPQLRSKHKYEIYKGFVFSIDLYKKLFDMQIHKDILDDTNIDLDLSEMDVVKHFRKFSISIHKENLDVKLFANMLFVWKKFENENIGKEEVTFDDIQNVIRSAENITGSNECFKYFKLLSKYGFL